MKLTKNILRRLIGEELAKRTPSRLAVLQMEARNILREVGAPPSSYDTWRAKVDAYLMKIWPDCGGLDALGVPEQALKLRFNRGDMAEATATILKDDLSEESDY